MPLWPSPATLAPDNDKRDMERVEYIKPDFPADAFAGTASYYVRYRVPYPGALLRDLTGRAAAAPGGRLLDLACGPGRVALDLAASFREVLAVDLEPEMVEAGRREAARRGVGNVRWSVGRAEEAMAPPASFDLITIGDAFHRLDQELVTRRALEWLRPRCCLAILGSSYGLMGGREPWQRIVAGVVQKWTGRDPSAGDSPGRPVPGSTPEHAERVLRESGFEGVASYPHFEPHDWTIEAIAGYLFSTSVCSRNALGANAGPFGEELRAALLAHDPGGNFRGVMKFGYTIGRKKG
ncbi:MAG: class I SAM-dependent methyltransferase [Opitutaceae bacterium]